MSFIQISHYMIITNDCLFPPLFSSFSIWSIQTVYTAYEHYNCLEFHWNMTYWHMLLGYSTFHQVYIRYIQHIMEIPTCHWINLIWMVLRGILICISLLYNCTLMSTPFTAFILVHRVHIVLTSSHWFYVYETYTSGILMVYMSP